MAISWYMAEFFEQYQEIAAPSARNDSGNLELVRLLLTGQISKVVGGVMTPPYSGKSNTLHSLTKGRML